jgi:F-type H+-transporting ATPase subunit delta
MPPAPETHSIADSQDAAPFDVGARKLAKVYAQAIVEAADARGCRGEVIDELRGIVRDVLAKVPGAAAVIGSPRMPAEEKQRLIDRLFSRSVTPTTLHAVQVVARHGRLDILPEIAAAVERLADELEGRRQAVFSTAVPLTADEQASIQAEFEKQLGGSLAATFHVDPEILGGLVARIDDTIYDHSVATGLVRLGDRLKQRSIHEIQHRRDRLGTA